MYLSTKNTAKVADKDAFAYACECCRDGGAEEQGGFFQIAKTAHDMQDFSETLVEWFYSGGWIYKDE